MTQVIVVGLVIKFTIKRCFPSQAINYHLSLALENLYIGFYTEKLRALSLVSATLEIKYAMQLFIYRIFLLSYHTCTRYICIRSSRNPVKTNE